jgi:putative transposase
MGVKEGRILRLLDLFTEDTPMRMLAAELDLIRERMPNRWSLVKDPEEFWGDLSTNARDLLRELLEGSMEVWRDQYVAADWHASVAERRDYRNGYYTRKHWPTALGPLGPVRVPRCRDKGLTQTMFQRLEDHRQEYADQVIEMLLAGVSTRRVGDLLERIIQLPVSAGQVSRLAKKLDAQVQTFHRRAFSDEWQYLILDAIHLKSRGTPRLIATGLRRCRRRVVLVAYGVSTSGIKQLLDFQIASSESEAGWRKFLWGLYRRGLAGEGLQLITTDGHGGLAAAVEDVYPQVSRQRCWFHKMQNVAGLLRRTDQSRVLSGLREVYDAPSGAAALKAYGRWTRRWQDLYPKAVACVEKDLDLLLAVYALPPEHRQMMRTSNGIERRFREVRRRTDSIGIFVDDASIERLVYGLISYFNSKYAQKVCREFRQARKAA